MGITTRSAKSSAVREVARLMIGSDAKTLPVLDDDRVVGVVTGDAVLEAVRPFLDAVTVDDAYTVELISAAPETSIGKAPTMLRESGIAHLPAVDGDDLVGLLSLYDVIEFTTRGGSKSQGGSKVAGRVELDRMVLETPIGRILGGTEAAVSNAFGTLAKLFVYALAILAAANVLAISLLSSRLFCKIAPTALGDTRNFGTADDLETAKQMAFAFMNESVVSV